MVSAEILAAAGEAFFSESVTVMLCGFGVCVVLLFSVLYLWQHSKEGRP